MTFDDVSQFEYSDYYFFPDEKNFMIRRGAFKPTDAQSIITHIKIIPKYYNYDWTSPTCSK